MTVLSRILFAGYLLILLWLILFKFSYEPFSVLSGAQTRSLNLIPFAFGRTGEMISNVVAFVPFGIMLGVSCKHTAFRSKLAIIFTFSVAVEIIQYVLAIGVTDITDVIMNTAGGLVGLVTYDVARRALKVELLDRGVLVAGTLILLAVLYLRIFVFIVKY